MRNEPTRLAQDPTDEATVTAPELRKGAQGDRPGWKRRLHRLLLELLQDRAPTAGPMI